MGHSMVIVDRADINDRLDEVSGFSKPGKSYFHAFSCGVWTIELCSSKVPSIAHVQMMHA